MAMRDLVDRECGGANPLMKLTSQVTHDRTFKQDGFRRVGHPQAPVPLAEATEDQLVNEFLGDHRTNMAPTTFRMDSLFREVQEMERSQMSQMPQAGPRVVDLATSGNWAAEYLQAESQQNMPSEWANEFVKQPANTAMIAGPEESWAKDFLEQNERNQWADEFHKDRDDNKWVDEFTEGRDSELASTARNLSDSITDPKLKNSEFMKFIRKIGDGDVTVNENKVTELNPSERADVWAQQFSSQSKQEQVDAWANEFSHRADQDQVLESDVDFWDKLQHQWDEMAKEDTVGAHPWLSDYDNTTTDSYYKDYKFEEDNPLRDHPDPFREGVERLHKGDIPNAVLLFEAAVQKNAQHAEAWQYLGTTQADNEQEPEAIAALRKCLEIEPGNLTALMSLAVSYTNESLQQQACKALKDWLQNNPKYAGLVPEVEATSSSQPNVTSFMSGSFHSEVKEMYIRAVNMSTKEIDADVQVALGVLFNLSGEYDKAVDCFNAALQIKPQVMLTLMFSSNFHPLESVPRSRDPQLQDSLLWNKLGATLANGSRSEEAVEAYHRALQLSPGYIRTRYNLGIACINLSAYKEAVEHFLSALNLQEGSRGPGGERAAMSNNIWSTMRMAIALMGKPELQQSCDNKDLSALNKEFSHEAT